jgi:predicted Ser/Thr protein kinase
MDLSGRTLGNYQIIQEIGRGGMAVVYRAYQPSLNRYVAIKVLPPTLAFDQEFVARFLREAQAAAGLRHPNIVVIHDVGEEGGFYYIVMEYLEGQTLKEVIEREGALPLRRVAHIIEQVAGALDYAHQRGFVHRDVKPANVFVGQGDHATLTDFGIAKAAWGAQLTRTGVVVGTPEYMSPEQAQGYEVDHRTDIYSLGIVLYEMVTGRVPFSGNTPHAVLHKVIYDLPPQPSGIHSQVSEPVENVLAKSLAKQPAERYASASELAQALKQTATQAETDWLRQQVAEVAAWLEQGRVQPAVERLEQLARAYPGDAQIAARLVQAQEQAHLSTLYGEVQQLSAQAQAKADQILATAPRYPDPDGLLHRLRGQAPATGGRAEVLPAPEEDDWPRWLAPIGLALVVIGSLVSAVLSLPRSMPEGNVAICLLFAALAALSVWKRLPLPSRRWLAASNLILVFYTTSLTLDIFPRVYLLGLGVKGFNAGSLLEIGILLGSGLLFWILFFKRQAGLVSNLIALGSLIVIVSYAVEWAASVDWLPWDRGYQVVYQKDYPWWVRNAAVILPALSLLSSTLISLAHSLRPDDSARFQESSSERKRAILGVVLTSLCLVGMGVVGLLGVRYQEPIEHPAYMATPYWGVWLMLIGLALICAGTILYALPILRNWEPSREASRPLQGGADRAQRVEKG